MDIAALVKDLTQHPSNHGYNCSCMDVYIQQIKHELREAGIRPYSIQTTPEASHAAKRLRHIFRVIMDSL